MSSFAFCSDQNVSLKTCNVFKTHLKYNMRRLRTFFIFCYNKNTNLAVCADPNVHRNRLNLFRAQLKYHLLLLKTLLIVLL